jgi:hypothetical protein
VLCRARLRQIVAPLRRVASCQLDRDDRRQSAPVQRFRRALNLRRIRQRLLGGTKCGIGAVEQKVCLRYVEDYASAVAMPRLAVSAVLVWAAT